MNEENRIDVYYRNQPGGQLEDAWHFWCQRMIPGGTILEGKSGDDRWQGVKCRFCRKEIYNANGPRTASQQQIDEGDVESQLERGCHDE